MSYALCVIERETKKQEEHHEIVLLKQCPQYESGLIRVQTNQTYPGRTWLVCVRTRSSSVSVNSQGGA